MIRTSVLALLSLFLPLLAACGGASASSRTPTTSVANTAGVPQSLDEGLVAQGLTPVDLREASRARGWSLGEAPRVVGRQLHVTENAGWNTSHTLFARRSDGTVVMVSPRPNTIVDRHVAGGCRAFVGGRRWFEDVVYDLPEGSRFGGMIEVAYEEHTDAIDYSDTQADGSPCPAPAID